MKDEVLGHCREFYDQKRYVKSQNATFCVNSKERRYQGLERF